MKQALTLLLLIVLAFTAACTTQTVVDDDNDGTAGVNTVVTERTVVRDEGDGRIVTAITGSASEQVLVTVDNIEIYSADKGWVTVAGDEDTYTLGAQQLRLAGDQEIDAGTYTQLRLDISSVSLGGQDVEVPGEKFVVPIDLVVPAESTTAVVLDIHGDESLRYVNGRYVFTPIVSVNTCIDATVMVDGEIVTTSCQRQPAIVTYEQDVTGRVVVNTVVREVPVIRVERVETTNTVNNTVTYNNTVIREVVREPTDTTANRTSIRTNTTANAT